MKNKVSSLIAEGILFCGSGILLLSYSLMSYAKSFNKAWSQSPYLFPALGWRSTDRTFSLDHRTGSSGYEAEPRSSGAKWRCNWKRHDGGNAGNDAGSHKKLAAVLSVLVLCVLYYLVLGEVSIPRVTIGILSPSASPSPFLRWQRLVFLIAMMCIYGGAKGAGA